MAEGERAKRVGGTITLRHVAERSGVSITTVSRILNGDATGVPVRPETRARIISAAADLGYKPNLLARALRGSRSSLLGVIVRDITRPVPHPGAPRASTRWPAPAATGSSSAMSTRSPDVAAIYGSMFEQSHADGILILGDIAGGDATLDDIATHHAHVVGVSDRVGERPRARRVRRQRAGHAAGAGAPLAAGPPVDRLRRRRADGGRSVSVFRLRSLHARARFRRPRSDVLHDPARPRARLPARPRAVRAPRSAGPSDGRLRRLGHDRDRLAAGGVPAP